MVFQSTPREGATWTMKKTNPIKNVNLTALGATLKHDL
jgi:hypothetical protein